jgi:hypothetical protein
MSDCALPVLIVIMARLVLIIAANNIKTAFFKTPSSFKMITQI